jgi:hypothetical protein
MELPTMRLIPPRTLPVYATLPLIGALLVAGCAVGPDFHAPQVPTNWIDNRVESQKSKGKFLLSSKSGRQPKTRWPCCPA